VDLGGHDDAGVQINRMLRLVGEMRSAILQFRDTSFRIGLGHPFAVGQRLAFAGPVEADQIGRARGLEAALLGQAAQHLLVIFTGVTADQAAQRGVGFLGRSIHPEPPSGNQLVLIGNLQDETEDGVVDLQGQPLPGHAEGRMVRHRLAFHQAQKPV
jgi:hypothetical protein